MSLQHSFVESPDMLNLYNGNAVCGEQGIAFIRLPDYFTALNKDYTYQLTPIGEFAPLRVVEEVHTCLQTQDAGVPKPVIEFPCFIVGGGYEGLRFSWMVTGIRKDTYAEENRIQVEVDKKRPFLIYKSRK